MTQEFDRAFFGVDADGARAMGPTVPHLVEVVYEALELSGVRFSRLAGTRVTWIHVGNRRDDAEIAKAASILGLEAEIEQAVAIGDGLLCLAAHLGAQRVRAGDIDLCIASCSWVHGYAAVLLGPTDRAAVEQWRVRCLLAGTATGPVEARVRQDAAARAAISEDALRAAPSDGTAGLLQAVAWLGQEDDVSWVGVDGRAAGQLVRVVLGVPEPSTVSDTVIPFLGISARSLPSLAGVVRATIDQVASDEDLATVAADAVQRPAFEQRLAVPLGPWPEVRARMEQWLDGALGTVAAGTASEPAVVFVVPPAGAQLVNMGDELYASEPAFRDALHRCDRVSRGLLPRALMSVLYPGHDRDPEAIDDPVFANPLTFAIAWSLSELYRGRGIEPIAVLGGGVGELCAAAIAGSLDMEQALHLAVERGRLLSTVTAQAAWAVLGATEEQARTLLLGDDEVDVVAIPAPGRAVIGGTEAGLARAQERATRSGLRWSPMGGGVAHSPLVDGILDEMLEAGRTVPFTLTDMPVISTVTGRRLVQAGPDHWVATLRAPLRVAAAAEAAWEVGGRTFLELAPRPTLAGVGKQTLVHQPARWLCALDPRVGDRHQLRENLASLWVRGSTIEHGTFARIQGGASLPTYAFDRRPLDDEWLPEVTEEVDLSEGHPSWLPALPELDAENTLVPEDEREVLAPPTMTTAVPMSVAADEPSPQAEEPALEDSTVWVEGPSIDDLFDLNRPQALSPMSVLPAEDDDGAMSVDSEPMMDLTLDDPTTTPRPFRPRQDDDAQDPTADLMGQGGPVWQEQWRDAPVPERQGSVERATFVLLVDERGIGDYVATLLEQAGHRVVRADTNQHPERIHVPDPSAEDAWVEVLDNLGTVTGAVHVLHLWTLDDPEGTQVAQGWPSVVSLCQEILAQGLPARIHLVTSGVVGGGMRSAAGAALWGLAGLLFAETGLLGGIIDLERDDEDPDLLTRHLLDTLESGEPPAWWSIRGGERRIRVVTTVHPHLAPPEVSTDGTWLIAGDVDHVSLELAGWLASRGVKRMFLVTAGAPAPEVLKAVLEFQKQGTACIVVRADAADGKGADQIRARVGREKKLAGCILRYAPTPRTLRDMLPADEIGRWQTAVAGARVIADLLGPDAPMWAWSEGSALDAAPGGGVGAVIATTLEAVLLDRPHSAVIHTAPHTTMGLARTLELVTGLAAQGGLWGVWVR
ncbi:MAG: acyltransferase domain-containing protein [Alphaproteobacteria bacterium]|nr:acyltransferase domain-containing protein [Alphaproteobacteria bacterium]